MYSCTGWRYRNEYDFDDHVSCKGSQRHGETGYGISGKSDFFGSLRGARGNSGVILSQLLRGFTKTIREEKEIDTIVLAQACERARATAYKAVMKPKEGTILTVAKGIAQKAAEMAEVTDDLEEFLPAVLAYAKKCWIRHRRCFLY